MGQWLVASGEWRARKLQECGCGMGRLRMRRLTSWVHPGREGMGWDSTRRARRYGGHGEDRTGGEPRRRSWLFGGSRISGETLKSVYDEAYIARKEEALQEAGIPLVRVEIEPEERSIH